MRAPRYSAAADELLSPAAINDPHTLYANLRGTRPLSRVEDSGIHLVANWELIQEVLLREEDFSANLTGVLYRGSDGKPACFELPSTGATNVIATADDPRHAVHRRLLQAHFTPTAIATLTTPIAGWTRDALEPLLAACGGDFVPLAEKIPALVVAHLLGLPEEDVEHFRVWAMMGGDMLAGEVSEEGLNFLATETARMAVYLGEHFDAALANPRTDSDAPLLHVLAHGVHDGDIDREEAIGIAIVLFGAGGESTAALIASCLLMLVEQPATAEQLRRTPELIPRLVEEVVRLEPPFKFHYRSVQRTCELGGYTLSKGDRLMLLWASANRDSEAVESAAELRLDRKYPKQHMGFGRGLHFCIGAVVARLEARIIIEQLLASSSLITLKTDGAAYASSIFIRRLARLELEIENA